ncbi:hypothetical protein ES705_21624 [subsurface metagenome]
MHFYQKILRNNYDIRQTKIQNRKFHQFSIEFPGQFLYNQYYQLLLGSYQVQSQEFSIHHRKECANHRGKFLVHLQLYHIPSFHPNHINHHIHRNYRFHYCNSTSLLLRCQKHQSGHFLYYHLPRKYQRSDSQPSKSAILLLLIYKPYYL